MTSFLTINIMLTLNRHLFILARSQSYILNWEACRWRVNIKPILRKHSERMRPGFMWPGIGTGVGLQESWDIYWLTKLLSASQVLSSMQSIALVSKLCMFCTGVLLSIFVMRWCAAVMFVVAKQFNRSIRRIVQSCNINLSLRLSTQPWKCRVGVEAESHAF
jgi:hypothetical protein